MRAYAQADLPRRLRNFINGGFVDSALAFAKVSPVDGREVSRVAKADAAAVDAAVKTARRAPQGPWRVLRVV